MKAKIQTLDGLFNTDVSYRIPVFQRPYAWGKTKQWQPLWDDARRIAEKLLRSDDNEAPPPHFMGALVLQLQSAESGEVVKRIVVDGQQRLTTLQLLTKAAHESFRNLDDLARANRFTKLIQNSQSKWGGDSDNETKVRQSNINDLQSFQDVIRGLGSENRPLRSIGEAYQYFVHEVSEWLNAQPAQRNARAKALETALTEYLQVATVDLDEGEKPHFIFAVLNARAEPLMESDHVKNTVMFEADIIDDTARANELWGPFDRNEWWRKETQEGRLSRIHLDRFLNYWLVMNLAKEISTERVSTEFNTYVEASNQPIEEIARAIKTAGQVYQDIEENRQPGIEVFLRRMKTMELGVVMPPLLWLYTKNVTEEKRNRSVRALESYLVRRMLCGIGSQGLNRLFVELLAKMEGNEAQIDQTIIDYLGGQTVDNRIWPTDAMLRDNLIGMPFKGTIKRQTMALEAIELDLRSSKTEDIAHASLTLEHIMPSSWERYWPLSEESSNGENDAEHERNQAVKELGNLTLVNGRLNPALSNSAWEQKYAILEQHTSLRLNWELLKTAPDVWNEEAIRERSKRLADLVVKIWPSAERT